MVGGKKGVKNEQTPPLGVPLDLQETLRELDVSYTRRS